MSRPDLLFGRASMGASFIQKGDLLELIYRSLVSPEPIQPLDNLLYRQAVPRDCLGGAQLREQGFTVGITILFSGDECESDHW